MIRKFLIALSFCGIVSAALASLPENLAFTRINASDGLSNNWVRAIHQDDTGFIWIGTNNGLNRYDGHQLKVYRVALDGAERAVATTVNGIARKSDEELWVATDFGLFVYNSRIDRVDRSDFAENVSVFQAFEDSKGMTWIASRNGLYRLDPDGLIQLYLPEVGSPNSIPNEYVNTVFEDSRQRLWVGTKGGLALYSENEDSFLVLKRETPEGVPGSADVLAMAEDRWGRIWMASAKGGLDVMDGSQRADEMSIEHVGDGDVVGVTVDRDDVLWVSRGAGGGLEALALEDYEFGSSVDGHLFLNDRADSSSIGDNSLFTVFEDRNGDLWIGSFGNGLSFASKRAKPFRLFGGQELDSTLVNVLLDDGASIWIGTEGGLSRYWKAEGRYQHFYDEEVSEPFWGTDAVFALEMDTRGNLWVGTWRGGLIRYDLSSDTFRRFLPDETGQGLRAPFVFAIEEDRDGRIWVGTVSGGLSVYDAEIDTIRHLSNSELGLPSAGNFSSINDIKESSDGSLLVSTYAAVLEIDPETFATNVFHHISEFQNGNNGSHILEIYEDSFGLVWLATDAGLELLDRRTGEFRSFGPADGLITDSVRAISEDGSGSLWITCSNGLTKYVRDPEEPNRGEFRTIDYGYGIAGMEFKRRAIEVASDKTVFLGSSAGVVSFKPDSILFNEVEPTIAITQVSQLVSLPNQPSVYEGLERGLYADGMLELSYKNADIRFQFSSLNFLNPEANRYKYRLVGYDSDWIDSGDVNSAFYTNVDPGDYLFEVIGSNNDGLWSGSPARLAISVSSPWWETPWWRGLFLALLVSTFVFLYRIRTDRARARARQLSEEVKSRTSELRSANELLAEKQAALELSNRQLEQHKTGLEAMVAERTVELEAARTKAEHSDRLKSSFLANLSHEVRTPMNAIIGFSNLLKDEFEGEGDRGFYIKIINENCENLLVLIDDILDLSMIDSDQVEIEKAPLEVMACLRSLESVYRLRNDKNLEIRFESPKGIDTFWIETDHARFNQILSNLIGNACKFTIDGTVEFGFEEEDDTVLFYVKDTGVGIAEEDTKRVFDRFYKVEDNDETLFRGTGLGLAISKELVNLLGGEIWVESKIGKGSVFKIRLPKGKVERFEIAGSDSFESNLTGVRVLVVEDEPTNFLVTGEILKRAGAEVYRAENGLQAVEFVRSPDCPTDLLILMDIKMPKMNGYDACVAIKRIKPELRIIALTAFAQDEDRRKVMESGFDGYVSKPIDSARLFREIRSTV